MKKLIALAILATLAGCAKPASEPTTQVAATVKPVSALLKPLLLKESPPAEAIRTVADVRQNAEDGEEVIVQGKVPPGNIKPFLDGLAGFTLMAVEDLEDPAVSEELACEEAATCPACRKLLDDRAVRVELVDESGKIIHSSLEGFDNAGPGSTITVKGKVVKKGNKVTIHATAFRIS